MGNEVLEFCNKVRKELGKEPVSSICKGYREDESRCPIARTIGGVCVEEDRTTVVGGDKVFSNPFEVQDFIDKFDNGELPEYEA